MLARTTIGLFVILMPLVFTGTACAQDPGVSRHPGRIQVHFDSKAKGWLGVSIDELTPARAGKSGTKADGGVLVSEVVEGSPADKAGVKAGDVIISYNNKKVQTPGDLIDEVGTTEPGTEIPVQLDRNGTKVTVTATIERTPRTFSFAMPRMPRVPALPDVYCLHFSSSYGLGLEELNSQLGKYFEAPDGKGVLVTKVRAGSKAEEAGFKAGDVIVWVGKDRITEIDDIAEALDRYKKGDKAEVGILRKGSSQKLALEVTEDRGDISQWNGGESHDVIIDLTAPEQSRHFRKELDELKRDLQHMKENLHDSMLQLRNRIKMDLNTVLSNLSV